MKIEAQKAYTITLSLDELRQLNAAINCLKDLARPHSIFRERMTNCGVTAGELSKLATDLGNYER